MRPYLKPAVLALLALVGAGLAARDAIANVYARRAPELALRANPVQPRALTTLIDARMAMPDARIALTLADLDAIHEALRRNPLQPGLVRLLGIGAELDRKPEQAAALITLANRISRRDVLTELWMVENAVRRNEIDEALKHYDIALTTSESIRPVLFPVLTNALSEPSIRSAIAPYLAVARPWRQGFLAYATANGKPAEVAVTLVTARATRAAALRAVQTDLLSRFVAAGDVGGALGHARRLPGGTPARFAAMGFTQETLDPAFQPLSWTLYNDADVEAVVDEDHRLQIRVAPERQAVAAMRVMRLQAGTYDIDQQFSFAGALPLNAQWEWHCVGATSRKIGELPIPIRGGSFTHRSRITVPASCDGVRILLIAGGAESQEDSVMTIEHLEVAPSGARSRGENS